jgi:hypothetical protein
MPQIPGTTVVSIGAPLALSFSPGMSVKKVTIRRPNVLRLLAIFSLLAVGAVILLLMLSPSGGSTRMSMTPGTTNGQVTATSAMDQAFATLSIARTDVCDNMGNEPAIDSYIITLPRSSSLQGACCTSMVMTKYARQIEGLKSYKAIPQIPPDPYNIPADTAKAMLTFYNGISLTASQQNIYESAQNTTADSGWCCCQCWAWYTHAGLAKYLVTQHNYTAKQVAAVINLEDCCGGS